MTQDAEPLIELDWADADALWDAWAPTGEEEDILARAAFERALRASLGMDDEGLYFRPGGWVVNVPATAARIACASAMLAASFHFAGIRDVEAEIIVAAATFVASMDVRPAGVSRQDRRLADRLQQEGMTSTPISATEARQSLPNGLRRSLHADDVADALDRLADAGLADRIGDEFWIIRAKGSEAWLRLRFTNPS